jgi:regulation of enolase protein 1 (concanavalin A-like superfamily)
MPLEVPGCRSSLGTRWQVCPFVPAHCRVRALNCQRRGGPLDPPRPGCAQLQDQPRLAKIPDFHAIGLLAVNRHVLAVGRTDQVVVADARGKFGLTNTLSGKQVPHDHLGVPGDCAFLQQDPENVWALESRARLLAACPDERIRDADQALRDATKACELMQDKNPLFLSTLAMAHANRGDFENAVKYQEQVRDVAPQALWPELNDRLTLYRQKKPFRLPGRYEAVEGWGRSVDPLGDCEIVADQGTLHIKVPGSMHNLHPQLRGMDAPRVLREVEGDFTAEVKVTCPIQPRNSLPGKVTTCHGAGLLVYSSAAHFLRAERDGYFLNWDNSETSTNSGRSQLSSNAPTIEYWQEGRISAHHTTWKGEDPQLPGESTWLRIERRGTMLRVLLSHDGQAWTEVQTIETTFPAKVQLGVHAINSSADEFAVTFTDWKLTQP